MIDPRLRSWKLWGFGAGIVFVGLTVEALILFGAYPLAWITTPDLTPEERSYYINKGLDECCVSARLPSRGMSHVSRKDIAEIGASRCTRVYWCSRWGGRSKACFDVEVTFYCAYDIKDTAGNAGTAILMIEPNTEYTPYPGKYEDYRRDKYNTNAHIEDLDKKLNEICSKNGCGPQ